MLRTPATRLSLDAIRVQTFFFSRLALRIRKILSSHHLFARLIFLCYTFYRNSFSCLRYEKQLHEGGYPMLRALFSIIYFLIFLFLIDLVFRNTLSVYTDILAVVCWIIALIISVGLADFTVKKIKENYSKYPPA